jgi:NAD-dependent dihydropyrimidine dehydrogenase PreA subunit
MTPEQRNRVFIDIEVEDSIANDAEVAAKLEEVCPVDIYRNADGRVEIVDENVDECVLCRLCLEASPADTVHVKKLYDGTELASSAPSHSARKGSVIR